MAGWLSGGARELERGREHFDRGEFALAVGCFERALPGGGRRTVHSREAWRRAFEARVHLGLAHFHAARYVEAEAEFDRALAAEPHDLGVRELRARIYYRSGRLAEAIGDLELTTAQQPPCADPLLLLALCRNEAGLPGVTGALDQAGAAALGRRAIAPPAGSRSRARAGPRSHRPEPRGAAASRAEVAVDSAYRAARARPLYPDLRCRLARLLIPVGRRREAEIQLERALGLNPRYQEARILLARLRLERGDSESARDDLEDGLQIHPVYPDLRYWLGFAHLLAGRVEAAVESLERAVGIHHDYARAHRLLGLAHHLSGRHEEAMRSLRRGFVRDRELPERLSGAGPAVAAPGRDPDAEGELRRAVARQSDYPDLHLDLARHHLARGDAIHAREACLAALALHPGYDRAALELGRLELERGSGLVAERLLAGVAERSPGWADAWALLGKARRLGGDRAGARETLLRALALNPGYVEAREDLARLEDRRWERAREGPALALGLCSSASNGRASRGGAARW